MEDLDAQDILWTILLWKWILHENIFRICGCRKVEGSLITNLFTKETD